MRTSVVTATSKVSVLQRSQVAKVAGDPLSAQPPNWGTEVNDALNAVIFTYFKADGTAIPAASLPLDIGTLVGAQTLPPSKPSRSAC